jgi:hypothetical protein
MITGAGKLDMGLARVTTLLLQVTQMHVGDI